MFHLPKSGGNLKPILYAQGWWKTLTKSSNQRQEGNWKTTKEEKSDKKSYHESLLFCFQCIKH